jgi:hypothetical protein
MSQAHAAVTETDQCDCLFCNAKCPECGADDVSVSYAPVFEFENDTLNVISITRTSARITLDCDHCGEGFDSDDDDFVLRPLEVALRKALDHSDMTEHQSIPCPDGMFQAASQHFVFAAPQEQRR